MSSSSDQRVDARVERGAGQAVQLAEVGDVLARGEARVEAARVGQHAQARARGRCGSRRDVDAVDERRCPASGRISV